MKLGYRSNGPSLDPFRNVFAVLCVWALTQLFGSLSPLCDIHRSVCLNRGGRKKIWAAQQKCASSLGFTSSVCVCGGGGVGVVSDVPPPSSSLPSHHRQSDRGRRGNVCGWLFAGSESNTDFGKISVKLVELETVKTKEEMRQSFFFFLFFYDLDFKCLVCKLLVDTHLDLRKRHHNHKTRK